MEILNCATKVTGSALMVITHDDRIASMAPRRFSIVDGILHREDRTEGEEVRR